MEKSEQLYFEMPNLRLLGIQDYIITNSNNLAFDLILKIYKDKEVIGIISGPPYSGKSHLCKILLDLMSDKRCLLVDKIQDNLLNKINSNDLIIIENIDTVKFDSSEENLFHIINIVRQNKKKLLLTSRVPIASIDIDLKDLRSRLDAIFEAKIKEPDDKLMEYIIVKIFNDRQITANPKIVSYLMKRLDRSYEGINKFLDLIDNFSLEKGKRISIKLISEYLG